MYALFLQAYPGYTVGTLQEELSWRQVEVMMDTWAENPPAFIRLQRIEAMLAKKFGFKITDPNNRPKNDDDLKRTLRAYGWM